MLGLFEPVTTLRRRHRPGEWLVPEAKVVTWRLTRSALAHLRTRRADSLHNSGGE
jgi:hypothetical protein